MLGETVLVTILLWIALRFVVTTSSLLNPYGRTPTASEGRAAVQTLHAIFCPLQLLLLR